jgi:hypothetical protein
MVAFQTQTLHWSSWIMVQGQMRGIHPFLINFPGSLPINCTTLKQTTYLKVALGNDKYHHQDGGIPNTEITLVLLDHGARPDERDTSILHKISGQFAYEKHYFETGHLPRSAISKH